MNFICTWKALKIVFLVSLSYQSKREIKQGGNPVMSLELASTVIARYDTSCTVPPIKLGVQIERCYLFLGRATKDSLS